MAVRAHAPPPPATAKGGAFPGPAAASAAAAAASAPRPHPWILRPEELDRSPSRRDGVAAAIEKGYRRKTCFFIDECGSKLKLPRLAIATAHVFLHRFYARQSFRKHDRFTVAQACLFLACKVEEHPQKLQKVLVACHDVRFRAQAKGNPLDPKSEEYGKTKEAVMKSERVLLNTISFDLNIEHAYEPVVELIRKLRRLGHVSDLEQRDFAQTCINFLNDSMRTSLCLQHEPMKVSSATVFLTTVYLHKLPPKGPMLTKFWALLSISERSLNSICEQVMELYESNVDFNEMRTSLRDMGHLPRPADMVPAASAPGGVPAARPPAAPSSRPPPPMAPLSHPPAAPSYIMPPPPLTNGHHSELKRPPPVPQPGSVASASSLGVKRLRADSAGGAAVLPQPLGMPTAPPPLAAAAAPVSS